MGPFPCRGEDAGLQSSTNTFPRTVTTHQGSQRKPRAKPFHAHPHPDSIHGPRLIILPGCHGEPGHSNGVRKSLSRQCRELCAPGGSRCYGDDSALALCHQFPRPGGGSRPRPRRRDSRAASQSREALVAVVICCSPRAPEAGLCSFGESTHPPDWGRIPEVMVLRLPCPWPSSYPQT